MRIARPVARDDGRSFYEFESVDRHDLHAGRNGLDLPPIGSASTLVAVTLRKNGLALSLGRFVKLAIPFAALQIVLATVYVLLVLR